MVTNRLIYQPHMIHPIDLVINYINLCLRNVQVGGSSPLTSTKQNQQVSRFFEKRLFTLSVMYYQAVLAD